jgi:hypothetical protein
LFDQFGVFLAKTTPNQLFFSGFIEEQFGQNIRITISLLGLLPLWASEAKKNGIPPTKTPSLTDFCPTLLN